MVTPIWLLDRTGTCPDHPTRTSIDSERDFLEAALHPDDAPLLIRGEQLCRWAYEYALVTGISVEEALSPVEVLRNLLPGLELDAISAVVAQLGYSAWDSNVVSTPGKLLRQIAPDQSQLWLGSASHSHTAEWLRWFIQNESGSYSIIAHTIGVKHSKQVESDFLKRCYCVKSAEESRSLLAAWVLGSTSMQPPAWEDRYWGQDVEWKNAFREYLISLLRPLLTNASIPEAIQRLTAIRDPNIRSSFALDIFSSIAPGDAELTRRELDGLIRFLPQMQAARLLGSIPQDLPSPPPSGFRAMAEWYKMEYRPWLRWILYTEQSTDKHTELGKDFSLKYLSTYIDTFMQGGTDIENVAWKKSLALRKEAASSKTDQVTLLVVLDGVGTEDLDWLQRALLNESHQLSAIESDLVMVSPPTATPFAKPAIISGSPPLMAREATADFVGTKAISKVVAAAQVEQFVTWTMNQPDKAYHQSFKVVDRDDLNHQIQSTLNDISNAVQRVVEAVSVKKSLRVVITADHGRLERLSPVRGPAPSGLLPHGRCAWGTSDATPAFSNDYFVEGDVVWINPKSFNLDESLSYAVRLDDGSFSDVLERQGDEINPHGGLFPEEVFVPWITFTNREVEIIVGATVMGSGVLNGPGEVEVTLRNDSAMSFNFVAVSIPTFGRCMAQTQASIPSFRTTKVTIAIDIWKALESTVVVVELALPSGDIHGIETDANFETRSLYRQTNPLDDLIGL